MFTKGGQNAVAGTYWNMADGSRIDLAEAGTLPGGRDAMYLKAPSAAVLAAGPVLGLVFAIFLPFIGIVMSLGQVGRKVADSAVGHAAQSVSFGWRPIEAYLAGRKRKKEAKEKLGKK